MTSDKVKIRVVANPRFFAEVTAEALRLDRSQSFLLQRCVGSSLPELAKLTPNSKEVAAMKKLACKSVPPTSGPPSVRDNESRVFFLSEQLSLALGRERDRLHVSPDDMLVWIWEQQKDAVRAARD